MSYNAFTYGYTDVERITYMMNIDFSYIINDISNGYITITILDNSIYTTSATPCNIYNKEGEIISHAYEWTIFDNKGKQIPFSQNQDGSYNYVCNDKSFTISFYLIQNITVSYSVSNKYGTSTLKRVLYFNTYPTINALLSRTSTAINKDEDSNNYKLFSLDANEYDSLYSLIKNVMKSGYIKYATGLSLDLLAEFWGVYREDKETDESLRARIVQAIAHHNSSITIDSLSNLISVLFNVSSNDIDLIERDDIPDYSWGATEEGVRKDMKPYDAIKRPAEFTFFIRNGPNFPVQMSYVRKIIEQSRAAGVYFNDVKVTFISDYNISFAIQDIVLYDELVLESGADWGRISWGTQGEQLVNTDLIGTYIFEEEGKYYTICSTNGVKDSHDGYCTTIIDIGTGGEHDYWAYSKWGIFKWADDQHTTFDGLKFIAYEPNVSIGYIINGTVDTSKLQYSIDEGTTWKLWESPITLSNKGDALCVRNNNTTLSIDDSNYITFDIHNKVHVNGNCNSLISNGNITPYCYYRLFKDCTSLLNTPLLISTILAKSCYEEMFAGCTSITTTPEFTVQTLCEKCYARMFEGCTSLVTVYDLPTLTTAKNCYEYMFAGCTSLEIPPVLYATTLSNNCYDHMFDGCTLLSFAPELPAMEICDESYYGMFTNCKSIKDTPILNATKLGVNAYKSMFEGCIKLEQITNLPATVMADGCYMNMFKNCTSIQSIPNLNSTKLAENCYNGMFSGCTLLSTIMQTLPATIAKNGCYTDMFKDCVSIISSPRISITSRANNALQNMFSGCTNLHDIEIVYNGKFDAKMDNMFEGWVYDVSPTGTLYYNGTDTTRGKSAIPNGWQVLLTS